MRPLLMVPEAAQVLNVRESWLREQVRKDRVPFTRLGKAVRFSEEHLAQIVAAGENGRVARSH